MARQHELAKAAFGRALERWRLLPGFNQRRLFAMEGAEAAELLEVAHAAAVEVLLWARAFSDAASGEDGIPRLPGYPRTIDLLPEAMKAARYAANKGVHLLVEIAHVDHVPTIGPIGMVPFGASLVAPSLRWVDQSQLPAPDSRDARIRPAFVARWCEQLVGVGLDEVEAYLARW